MLALDGNTTNSDIGMMRLNKMSTMTNPTWTHCLSIGATEAKYTNIDMAKTEIIAKMDGKDTHTRIMVNITSTSLTHRSMDTVQFTME